jgi:hypothetical protein
MPITYGTYTKQTKSLPLTLHADGSATVSMRFGFVGADEVFNAIEEKTFSISQADVSEILDAPPIPGITRRNDLSLAIYTYLVTRGLIEPGTIS